MPALQGWAIMGAVQAHLIVGTLIMPTETYSVVDASPVELHSNVTVQFVRLTNSAAEVKANKPFRNLGGNKCVRQDGEPFAEGEFNYTWGVYDADARCLGNPQCVGYSCTGDGSEDPELQCDWDPSTPCNRGNCLFWLSTHGATDVRDGSEKWGACNCMGRP